MNIDAFWSRVKILIKEKSVTQAEAAKAVGLSSSKFRVWMSRRMIPPLSYAYKISRYLGVSLEYLINGKDSGSSSQTETINTEMLFLLKDVNKKLTEMQSDSGSRYS